MNKPPPGATPAGWHSISKIFTCAKEYQFAHVRKVLRPEATLPDPLGAGLCFHAGRARWFTLKFQTGEKAWSSIRTAVEEEAERQELPVSREAVANALSMLTVYCDYWSKKPLPRPIATEYAIGPAQLVKGSLFYRTARLDDVSIYPNGGGKLWLGEAKTTSQSIAEAVAEYTLHGQTLLQPALWYAAPQGFETHGHIAGVMLDIFKKGYGKEKPQMSREAIPISPWAIEWFKQSLHAKLREASQIEWDSEVVRNVSACTRQIGRKRVDCPYKELCRYGKAATGRYVLEGGGSLLAHKPQDGMRKMPWE